MSDQAKSSVGWTVWLWWVLASAGGGAMGFAAATVPIVRFLDQMGQDMALRMSETVGLILAFGLMGAVVGFATGGVLVWLLRKPESALP